ncbi:MAG: hypothetical protein ACPGXK_12230 [Phycisphaerae bacterium]
MSDSTSNIPDTDPLAEDGNTSSSGQSGSSENTSPSRDQGESRVFPCESCGADLEFHIGAQSLKCTYCGFVKSLRQDDRSITENDYRDTARRMARLREQGRNDEIGCSEVNCSACGGTLRFTGTLTSSHCVYCGTPLQRESVHEAEHRIPVDAVLPFQISRDTAQENLAAWVKSLWFAPTDFQKRGISGEFAGVYLPYWTFDSLTYCKYEGQRGEHYYVTVGSGKNKRRVRKTRWYPASGEFQRFFDDILVVAGQGLPDDRLRALEPWPLKSSIPFNREALAGFLARTYDVQLDEGCVRATNIMDDRLMAETRSRIGGDVQRVHYFHTSHDAITYKHLLLPVWMLTYRYNDKPYQVVINAGTGEVQGDRPYSWIKIGLTIVAAAAAIATAAYFFS